MESDEEQSVKTEIIYKAKEKSLNHCTFDECEYNSYETSNLRRHINTVHEKKKVNFCAFQNCKYSDVDQSNLKRHYKNRHKGKKPPAKTKTKRKGIFFMLCKQISDIDWQFFLFLWSKSLDFGYDRNFAICKD